MSPFVFLKIETFKDAHSDRVLFLIFLICLFALIIFYYRECSRKYDQGKNVRVWKDHHEDYDHVYRVVSEEDRSKSVNINIDKFLPEESSVCHWKIEEENACDDDTSPLLVVWGGNTRKEHALSWQPSSWLKDGLEGEVCDCVVYSCLYCQVIRFSRSLHFMTILCLPDTSEILLFESRSASWRVTS